MTRTRAALASTLFLYLIAAPTPGHPQAPQERPAPQMAPMQTDFTDAYAAAVSQNRLLIVLFGEQTDLKDKALPQWDKLRSDPALAATFVFGTVLLPDDPVGLKAARQLKMAHLPAVSVFTPRTDGLQELSRFEAAYAFEDLRAPLVADVCKALGEGRFQHPQTQTALGCKK